jgi:multisubunit Na+/H+ antiporter MnhB subunit
VTSALVFDLLLCVLIGAVALSSVVARDMLAAIVFFIVFGMLAAIAWVRLDAVDVALAEAAIGAGLTGILLVGAAARLRRRGKTLDFVPARTTRHALVRLGQFALCISAVSALVALLLTFPDESSGLHLLAEQSLAASGVTNPVTAVLLNFRAYDTLLEAIVLLVALVGIWSLAPDRFWGGIPGLKQHARPDGVLAYFGRLLPAVGFLVGVHLLWAGSDSPGGAFQAGTVLAAVWLLIVMAGLTDAPAISNTRLRLLVVSGPAFFLLVGGIGALGGVFLGYPTSIAKVSILAIELLLAVSIAVTLALLVLGAPRRTS